MASLVDMIFASITGVMIILATLLPNGNTVNEAGIEQFNAELVLVIATRSSERITLVNIHSSEFSLADLGPDGTHPTEEGYLKKATVFYTGIVSMADVTQPPATVAGIDGAAALNDNGTAINVEVTYQVMVLVVLVSCVMFSIISNCDPTTSIFPYGSQITVTKITSAISSSTLAPVLLVQLSSSSKIHAPTSPSISTSSSGILSSKSKTLTLTSILAAIHVSSCHNIHADTIQAGINTSTSTSNSSLEIRKAITAVMGSTTTSTSLAITTAIRTHANSHERSWKVVRMRLSRL